MEIPCKASWTAPLIFPLRNRSEANCGADVEEALELLQQYDLHGSMGMMIHFAIADAKGDSAATEKIWNLDQFVMAPTERGQNANTYVRELKDNDRL